MKIIFAGTPKFAVPTLDALRLSEHEILAVFTQPDKPAGRGLKITASPVKEYADTHNLPVFQTNTFKSDAVLQKFKEINPDVLVDVACGLLIPEEILDLPRYGSVNVHPSLLPRWRGAAPIQRALLEGDRETGITIMQMDAGLDTGAILDQEKISIENSDTAATLLEKTAAIGAELLLKVLQKLEDGALIPLAQQDAFATYAKKVSKEEAKINWQESAEKIARQVRAFDPWPVAYALLDNKSIRIWSVIALRADFPTANYPAGTIIRSNKEGIDVITKDGVLRLLKIQLPGKKVMPVSEIINAYSNLFAKDKVFS